MKFYFKAKNQFNETIKGRMESPNKERLQSDLLHNQLYPLIILKDYPIFVKKTIKDKNLLSFIQEWHSLESSGIKTQDSIRIIKDNTNDKTLRNALNLISLNLDKGIDVKEGFNSCRYYFPELFIEILNIGFDQGNMSECLSLLKDYYLDKTKNQAKIKNALIYPKILLITLFLAILIISKFIVPQFQIFIEEIGTAMNPFTKAIFHILNIINNHIALIIIIAIALVLFIFLIKRNKKYQRLMDFLKLRIPIIKDLIEAQNIYLFCKTSLILWLSNYNKIKSIDIVSKIVPNYYFKKALKNAEQLIYEGMLFGEALDKQDIFDSNLCRILKVGEENNVIITNLANACTWYNYELQYKTENFLKVIEPLSIVVMALFIFFIIIVVFMPMLSSIKMVI